MTARHWSDALTRLGACAVGVDQLAAVVMAWIECIDRRAASPARASQEG